MFPFTGAGNTSIHIACGNQHTDITTSSLPFGKSFDLLPIDFLTFRRIGRTIGTVIIFATRFRSN